MLGFSSISPSGAFTLATKLRSFEFLLEFFFFWQNLGGKYLQENIYHLFPKLMTQLYRHFFKYSVILFSASNKERCVWLLNKGSLASGEWQFRAGTVRGKFLLH